MDAVVLIAAGVFVAIALVILGLYVLFREREERTALAAKVEDLTTVHGVHAEVGGASALASGPVQKLLLRATSSLGGRIKPQKQEEISVIQRRFLRAGLRGKNALITFFGAKALLALCLSIGFIVTQILFRWQLTLLAMIVVVFIFVVVGFYIPNIWLALKVARRQDDFMRGFPDALDLLVVCAEAGMGLDAAIKRVGDEMRMSNKVVSEEFSLLNLELRAGKQRKDAMKSMAERVDLDDARSWVTLLIQTDRLGTSIAQALRVHSDSMRTKRSMRVEELAAKLAVKLLFPTILLIFPSLFLVIVGPALIRAWRMWTGQ